MEFIRNLIDNGLIFPKVTIQSVGQVWFYIIFVFALLVCIILPYLLGSLNFAVILSRKMFNEDVREHGSKNGGATNMLRTYGKKAAALTFALDILKAIVSALIGYVIWGINGASVAGLFCMIGHMFPIYYKFKGGKGVATLAATVLMIDYRVCIILLVCFVAIVFMTKFVSLGSVMCCLIYPLILYRMTMPGLHVVMAVIAAALVIFMHRANIKRLLAGTESKISFSKKDKKHE